MALNRKRLGGILTEPAAPQYRLGSGKHQPIPEDSESGV